VSVCECVWVCVSVCECVWVCVSVYFNVTTLSERQIEGSRVD